MLENLNNENTSTYACDSQYVLLKLKEKLQFLPNKSGVYLMKDAKGKIIYVGKAVILKNRVKQYFQNSKNQSPKVRAMVAKIADFETIITMTEVEALVLECNLIKKYRPRYNISLKDDKTYPYVKVTTNEAFPRVFVTRKLLKDGAKYFGPFTNVKAVHESLKLLRKLFPLRSCKNMQVQRPCLEYHIKRCLAPCHKEIAQEDYQLLVKSVCLFLEGKTVEIEKSLEKKMLEAAENLAFESASRLRDQLQSIRKITEKQHAIVGNKDQDVIGIARSKLGVCTEIFFIRQGKMLGREHFFLTGSEEETIEEIVSAFLKQYYYRATFIPPEILLPCSLTESDLLLTWLTEKRGGKVVFYTPKRGKNHDLVKMARENAQKYLFDEENTLKKEYARNMGAVEELGKYLSLSTLPRRMECFDISHMQGSETVASMVVFQDGMPDKKSYRRFKIVSAEGKPDDFLSMREVTARRYGKKDSDPLPDLIIIDGGKGQLSSAIETIRSFGHLQVPVVSLAESFEYIFTEGESEPIVLPRESKALYLVERIRDEAHRFAITYHRNLRNRRNLVSILDHIDGIGPKRRKALWDFFGTLDKIKEASVNELLKVPAINEKVATSVYNFFRNKYKVLP